MSIPDQIIDAVRERTSMLELAAERVELKRSGKGYVGRCPFHNERTPSFHVNEEEGFFHCFGCEKKGSVFSFVMETRGFTFPEAVRFLASRAGITVPDDGPDGKGRKTDDREKSKALRQLLHCATQLYHTVLVRDGKGQRCRDYLAGRAISDDLISRFQLGYAPDAWDYLGAHLFKAWKEAGFSGEASYVEKLSVEAGLRKQRSQSFEKERAADSEPAKDTAIEKAKETERERHYDIFRHRLIFPICRSDGGVIALGGRLIEKAEDAPKYMNSSENPVYQKRKSFFGIHHALPEIRRQRHVYLVEGYMDVIGMHRAGLSNTVATCGTAVTPDHVRVLRKVAEKVTVVFDGDASGRKAAAQCFEIFLNSGLVVSGSVLPDGEDPDSLAGKFSAEEFQQLIQRSAENIATVFLSHALGENPPGESGAAGAGTEDPAAKGKIAERYTSVVSRIDNNVERELLVRLGADRLGVSESSLLSLMQKGQKRKASMHEGSSHQGSSHGGDFTGRAGGSAYRKPAEAPPRAGASSGGAIPGKDGISAKVPMGSEPPSRNENRSGGRPSNPASSSSHGTSPQRRMASATDRYFAQLIVAVLCEPLLAKSVLEVPALATGLGVDGELPDAMRSFLTDIARLEGRGISDWRFSQDELQAQAPLEEYKEDLLLLTEILLKHNFDAANYLREAIRQTCVGGHQPERLADEASKVLGSHALAHAMESLRSEEKGVENQEDLQKLVQQKLEKKRQWERLRTEGR